MVCQSILCHVLFYVCNVGLAKKNHPVDLLINRYYYSNDNDCNDDIDNNNSITIYYYKFY